MKRSKIKRCGECGAQLREGVATCPLCGANRDTPGAADSWAAPVVEVDSYQSNVRDLREQLKKLRDDHPEAV
jgi:RNA polymerase subunit RPABC4/transcription elongation factor Spt4